MSSWWGVAKHKGFRNSLRNSKGITINVVNCINKATELARFGNIFVILE